jgi:hypothetical protein
MAKHILDDFPFLKQSKAHILSVILPLNNLRILAELGNELELNLAQAHDVFKKEIMEGV